MIIARCPETTDTQVLRVLLILVLLLALTLASGAFFFTDALFGEPSDSDAEGNDTLIVSEGMYASAVAMALENSRLIDNADGFIWYLRLRGKVEDIKAGTYIIPHSSSSGDIAQILTNGRVARTEVTIPEGWTAEKIAARLQSAGVTDSAGYVDLVRSEAFTRAQGFDDLSTLDGLLFPETYVFPLNSAPEIIIAEMVTQFRVRMGDEWIAKAREDQHGLRGILTLASIVEGEINLVEEADDVAAVYRNRLARGMKLEADPTIQFLMPNGPKRLLLADLRIDSPYNTYLYRGLPPGPINNPGEPTLRAAVKSPEAFWLFMVATGDGGHTFTRTYDEHLQAKEKFDAVRRIAARQQRINNQ